VSNLRLRILNVERKALDSAQYFTTAQCYHIQKFIFTTINKQYTLFNDAPSSKYPSQLKKSRSQPGLPPMPLFRSYPCSLLDIFSCFALVGLRQPFPAGENLTDHFSVEKPDPILLTPALSLVSLIENNQFLTH
jgi:predicted Rossmann fold nucleotide-binding protein DprA/Smf involved in DNA uptake